MNKIKIEEGIITSSKKLNIIDNTIYLDHDDIIKIDVINTNNLTINFIVKQDIKITLLEVMENTSININYSLEENAKLESFCFSFNSSCYINTTLLDKANFIASYSCINEYNNTYKINIEHIGYESVSKLTNHGLNQKDEPLNFIINATINKGAKNVTTIQDSKIITLNDNTSLIEPNLIINEEVKEASHKAYIGTFKQEEIFYLSSRNIKEKDALKLLSKAFLIGNFNLDHNIIKLIIDKINNYWR